ncbi:MAG: ATP-binding protein [Thermodesulfobacteriota bacterium]
MREIVVISGKGGTGKTSLAAAFADLARNAVICDLDVDAPDMHLLLDPLTESREDFISGHEAVIDKDACTGCGTCAAMCRFGAVREAGGTFEIDPARCEGCKVCVAFCPAGAVAFPEKLCGEWYVSQTRFGTMVHARLNPGEENSGRLVALLKNKARDIAASEGQEIILCDGAPGIGCPVISSLSGADLAVAVTEPSPSGLHDLERVLGLCGHFRIPACVIINKCDLNAEKARQIEALCARGGHEIAARLPHDTIMFEAMLRARAVTELPDTPFAGLLRQAWKRMTALAWAAKPKPLEAAKP